jgi:hypothetical protein
MGFFRRLQRKQKTQKTDNRKDNAPPIVIKLDSSIEKAEEVRVDIERKAKEYDERFQEQKEELDKRQQELNENVDAIMSPDSGKFLSNIQQPGGQ